MIVCGQFAAVLPVNALASEALPKAANTDVNKAVNTEKPFNVQPADLALPDGATKIKTEVSTFPQLKAALEDGLTNYIVLTGDINVTSDVIVNKNVRIEGNGYTISQSTYKIRMKSTSIIDLKDVVMTNNGSNPIFTGFNGSTSPTLNIIDNVQIRGYVIGGDGALSMSVAGASNQFVSTQNNAIQVSKLRIEDDASIERLEATNSAIVINNKGIAEVGNNASINMSSSRGYAFDANTSDLVFGENVNVASTSKYGSIRANSIRINNGSNLTLASGDIGNGIDVAGNIKIGDKVYLKATGDGTALNSRNRGYISVGQDSNINFKSNTNFGIYTDGQVSFGDRTSVSLETYNIGIRTGNSGVRFGTISNQEKPASEKADIIIKSATNNGIWSNGPVSFGDNTNVDITSKSNSIYADGVAQVDVGSEAALNLNSSSGQGVSAGGLTLGKSTEAKIVSYNQGISLRNTSGNGLQTDSNVNLDVKSNSSIGIDTVSDTIFGANNNINVTALTDRGFSSNYASDILVGEKSNLHVNATLGIFQDGGFSSNLLGKKGSNIKIDATNIGVQTTGSVNVQPESIFNVRAASGNGNNPAIQANGIVTFEKDSKIYVETLSNQSEKVFDLTGGDNSKLVLNGVRYFDFRQGNRSKKGHIIRGRLNDNDAYRSRVQINNMPQIYAWGHESDWSKTPTSNWEDVNLVTIPLSYKVGDTVVDYYSGSPAGQNIAGFDLFNYSRVSTVAEASVAAPTVDEIYTSNKKSQWYWDCR